MNLSLNPEQFKQILPILTKYKALIATLVFIGVCGYTGYQISLVVAVAPDAATIAAEQDKVKQPSARFDTATIDAITKQQAITAKPDLSGIGTANPFFGN
jgi:hypothetical protein